MKEGLVGIAPRLFREKDYLLEESRFLASQETYQK
jgi:hypothetical protein